ncbi:MAG: ATP-dependent DNA helicase RecG, partial [Erysipelotrichaceae bacterium]|nr:ATP-dependent DNA helicase RecG [Erysipelotrichaceae bacterium]
TLSLGRQVYIIAAAIERNDSYQAKDVNGLYQALNSVLKPYRTALMHGRLDGDEKDAIMEKFSRNEIQVLISTTVVEVGVNVPNATTMIIYDSDRFGLSQLHQLRGRVQRSDIEGSCYLLTDSKDESVLKRLNVLCETNDGFRISYEDLRLRGPGDILGTRQSGLPAFVLGNLIEDTRFIQAAREDAHLIMKNLDNSEYKAYYDKISQNASKNFVS